MILPAQEIAARGFITPFCYRTVCCGMTYGLSHAGYDIRIKEQLWMPVGQFELASSIEHFTMPDDVLGQVCDKSTWARRGIVVQNTIIEPGWRGFLTLEIKNLSDSANYTILAGSPIAQIIFMQLKAPTDCPYSGKYQDQKAGPQAAILDPQ